MAPVTPHLAGRVIIRNNSLIAISQIAHHNHAMLQATLLIIAVMLPTALHAHPESWYVEQSCTGEVEVRLSDRTRVDCLTDQYAIEYDFTNKWYEAIGQALHYGLMTGRKAGIVLVGTQKDAGYKRALNVIRAYGLPIELNTLKK